MKKLIAIMTAILSLTFAFPAHAEQTTVIYLDNIKSSYDIGEELTFSIGVASPTGGYLKSAYCGFGYNQSTMELISEADTEDHIWIKSNAPQYRLISKDIKFKVKASGKIYFIAGAYSGPGQITGYDSNNQKILCPRASVVYKAGTGIYTPTSDCDAKSITIYDADTGKEIVFNRSFDKYQTEYTANVSPDISNIRIEAEPALEEDRVVYPENTTLHAGINTIKVGIQAVGGEVKDYTFTILRPSVEAEVTNISIIDNLGEAVPYEFSPDVYEYDLSVGRDIKEITFRAETGPETEVEYPEDTQIRSGYNIYKVKARREDSVKEYEYYIYKEFSELTLKELIVETPDGISHPFDKDFSPEEHNYVMQVTSDIDHVTIKASPAITGDSVKEDYGYPVRVDSGENTYPITVTDGINESVYTLKIIRDASPVAYMKKPEKTIPKNLKEWTEYNYNDLSILAKIGIPLLLIFLITASVFAIKQSNKFSKTDEGRSEKSERARKKRLRKANKEFEKQNKK